MNFRERYKNDNEKINIDKEKLKELADKMKSVSEIADDMENTKGRIHRVKSTEETTKKRGINYKLITGLVASLVVVSIIGLNLNNLMNGEKVKDYMGNAENNNNKDSIRDNIDGNNDNSSIDNNEITKGVKVPEIKISAPKDGVEACMMGMVIYKGKVYVESRSKVSIKDGKALMEEKLGVTHDLSKSIQDNGTSAGYIDLDKVDDFASFMVGADVYKVKGYSDDFRILTYYSSGGMENIEIWECLSGITVESGADVFEKMNIKGNLSTLNWDTFNNWNNETPDPKEVIINEVVSKFIDAMYEAVPVSLEDENIRNQFFYSKEEYNKDGEEKQKFLYLKLNDGIMLQIRVFSNGHVMYSGMPGVVFKVEQEAFDNMWEHLK